MPAKGGYPATWRSPGVHVVAGKFVTAGAAAPGAGVGFTVSAPTAAGVYTVTLTDGRFNELIACPVGIEDPSLNATTGARFGANNVPTAGTFTIVTSSVAGTDAQLTGPLVNFVAVLRNTGVTR